LLAEHIPAKTEEIKSFVNQLNRDVLLLASGIYISTEQTSLITAPAFVAPTDSPINIQKSVIQLLNKISGLVFIGSDEPWTLLNPSSVTFEVKRLPQEEQHELWRCLLFENSDATDSVEQNEMKFQNIDKEISRVVNQFNLNMHDICAAANQAKLQLSSSSTSHPPERSENISKYLWDSCRLISRYKLKELAQLILTKKDMPGIVLPAQQRKILSNIAIHVTQRSKVYGEWGFEATSSRGLGITALFSGPSGTGKTMAAEVLSNNLGLDLFRIDLSAVVSKYIGETEKNLKRVFEAAEDVGAILFFDEADAIFGKRTEVQDSHDRFANIEISYLLQRMENYSGLAILATNMKSALDPAFMRRINFVVDFAFPSEDDRRKNIDVTRLARLNITGGNIRNIALNASFLAADKGTTVQMEHIMLASQLEYAKLGKPLTHAEYGSDWLAFLGKNTTTTNDINNNNIRSGSVTSNEIQI
jgi:hypothetical protein